MILYNFMLYDFMLYDFIYPYVFCFVLFFFCNGYRGI